MAGRVLLDTNIVIAFFANEKMVLQQVSRAEVFVSSTVLGELHFGALKSAHVAANQAKIGEFASAITILNCDAATARQYGEIKNRLWHKGRPIPENDVWIAPAAIQHGLFLATRDDHFKEVDGLTIEAW